MELICTRCDGLGEERWMTANMTPQCNVAGWFPGPAIIEHADGSISVSISAGTRPLYYRRTCMTCNGDGFVDSGPSVPLVGRAY